MSASSLELDAVARRNERAILQALASAGIGPVAEVTGVDETTVGRWREKDIPRFCKMLASLGLKTVPTAMKCYRRDAIEAIFTLARMQVEAADSQSLIWEEPST